MSYPIIDHLAKLDAEAAQRKWTVIEHEAGAAISNPFVEIAEVDCILCANAIVSKHNAWPAIERVLRAAIAVVENTLPSGFPYPVVPAEHINELHWAIDALRAMEVK